MELTQRQPALFGSPILRLLGLGVLTLATAVLALSVVSDGANGAVSTSSLAHIDNAGGVVVNVKPLRRLVGGPITRLNAKIGASETTWKLSFGSRELGNSGALGRTLRQGDLLLGRKASVLLTGQTARSGSRTAKRFRYSFRAAVAPVESGATRSIKVATPTQGSGQVDEDLYDRALAMLKQATVVENRMPVIGGEPTPVTDQPATPQTPADSGDGAVSISAAPDFTDSTGTQFFRFQLQANIYAVVEAAAPLSVDLLAQPTADEPDQLRLRLGLEGAQFDVTVHARHTVAH